MDPLPPACPIHQLDMAENLCDRVAIMSQGRLLANRPINELLALFRQEFYQIRVRAPIKPEAVELFPGFVASQENGHTVLSGAWRTMTDRSAAPKGRPLMPLLGTDAGSACGSLIRKAVKPGSI